MKKSLTVFLCLILAAWMLVSCGGETGSEKPTEESFKTTGEESAQKSSDVGRETSKGQTTYKETEDTTTEAKTTKEESSGLTSDTVTETETDTTLPTETEPTPTETEPTPTETESTPTETEPTPTETEPTPTETETKTTEDSDPLTYRHYSYSFVADLSDYEQYMDPTTNEYLLLVNADHPLTGKDIPDDLVEAVNTRKDGRDPAKMRLYAEKAMEALYKEAEAEGMLYENVVKVDGETYKKVLSITSAYRSYYDQAYLYNSYVERDAKLYPEMTLEEVKKEVATYSCPPGTSEHQTGLCADMHNWPTAGRYMADDFANSAAGKWLKENCHKFGYILRFDKDKTDITGITYESWHFRYVGRFHATQMHELDMCLEEYVEYLTQYGYVING